MQHAAGNGVEALREPGIALVWRGDERVVERLAADAARGALVTANLRDDFLDQRPGALDVLKQHLNHRLDGDIVVIGMPAVIVGDHRHCRVAELFFAR